jgi:hypothetical protein
MAQSSHVLDLGEILMGSKRRHLMFVGLVAVAALLLGACKVTGGGWIQSATGAKKATFGFNWQTTFNETTNETRATARGSWSDGDVKFKIDRGIVFTFTDGQDGCAFGFGHYVSQSKADPGDGELTICLCDYGEPGATNGDTISIQVTSGPYSGYTNSGELQGGNLQVKS